MEPILSKQQIADLLAAIRSGKVPLDLDEDDRGGRFLDYQPVDLFHLAKPKDDSARIPNLDIIVDNFCRNYGTSLTNNLQRTFAISRTSLETIQYKEYLAKHKNPGALGMVNMSPLVHNSLLVFDRQLSYSMLEVMLGASSALDPLQLDRPLTTIELSILKTTMTNACHDLNKAFRPLTDLNSSLTKVENSPRLVSITDPESEVVVTTFHVKIDELSGEIDLIIPAATLDPLRNKLDELLMVDVTTRDNWRETLEFELKRTTVDIIAQSGAFDLTIETILRLQAGDIVPLSYDPNSPLKILVGNLAKFNARPGTSNGRKAIRITGVAQEGI